MEFENLEAANKAFAEQTAQLKALTESVSKLEANNKALVDEKRQFKEQAQTEAERAEQARLEAAEKSGNIDEIKTAYTKRAEEEKAAYENQLSVFKQGAKSQALDSVLSVFDEKYRGIVGPSLGGRIDIDTSAGKMVPVVLDESGKPTALSLKEFADQLKGNESYAGLLQGSQARGAGALNQGAISGGATSPKGNMGGSKAERQAAIAARFKLDQ